MSLGSHFSYFSQGYWLTLWKLIWLSVVVTTTVRNGEEITTNNIKTSDLLQLLDNYRYIISLSVWFQIWFSWLSFIKVAESGRIKKRTNFSNCLIRHRLVSCSWKRLLTNFLCHYSEIKYHFQAYCEIIFYFRVVSTNQVGVY